MLLIFHLFSQRSFPRFSSDFKNLDFRILGVDGRDVLTQKSSFRGTAEWVAFWDTPLGHLVQKCLSVVRGAPSDSLGRSENVLQPQFRTLTVIPSGTARMRIAGTVSLFHGFEFLVSIRMLCTEAFA
jgi:hypothetical protein